MGHPVNALAYLALGKLGEGQVQYFLPGKHRVKEFLAAKHSHDGLASPGLSFNNDSYSRFNLGKNAFLIFGDFHFKSGCIAVEIAGVIKLVLAERTLVVPDVLDGLQYLAANGRNHSLLA